MLQALYQTFGFPLALLLSFVVFMLVILWLAGLAGLVISQQEEHTSRPFSIVLGVLFPFYPMGWLVWDMIQERRRYRE
jgi:ABC-type microcin C transport system permease subunit YejB